MRISNKVYLLTVLLLAAFALNIHYSLRQLNNVVGQFQGSAQENVVLMDFVLKLRQYQAEKSVLFERLLRITEEMEYEDVAPARKQHLADLAKVLGQGFDDLRQKTGEQIMGMKGLLRKEAKFQKVLEQTEKSEIAYEDFLMSMAKAVENGNFELSIGDIQKAQSREHKLAHQFNQLLDEIHALTKDSLTQASLIEKKMSGNMLRIFAAVFIFSILIVLIVHGLLRLLQDLTKTVRRVGEGDFSNRLDEMPNNEIGEVNRALNVMSIKLDDARRQLEEANVELAHQLDITRQQKIDLEKVNKELDDFAYTVSHDIRSPLMGIMSYCSILEKQYLPLLDERGARCLDRIRHGTNRLNGMIDDLLALTRISRIKNPYEYTDISQVVADVLDRMEYKIRESRIKVIIKKPLPNIFCDRIKIGEVFLNLISNAVKFSSKRDESGKLVSGHEYSYVEVGYRDLDAEHEFYVKDNGIGIAKEDQEAVFAIFKRLDTADQYEGTGAGLSIVKTVIEDHQGKIRIDSAIGAGATFYFTIPKLLAPPAALPSDN